MGKSTAAKIFRALHVPVFDADATVHRLQAPGGQALGKISAAFPGTVADGVLDRARLRHLVLTDPAAMHQLESIIHPLVRRAQARFLARARARGATLAVVDVPLLFETGGERLVDQVIVVSAPRSVQIARLRRRRRMSDSDITRMIALQMPDAEKRRRADLVVRTGLSRFHTVRAIRRWLNRTG